MCERCKNYVGVTCVNGTCPNALAEEYPEYGYEKVSCEECGFYKGCNDCIFFDGLSCEIEEKLAGDFYKGECEE